MHNSSLKSPTMSAISHEMLYELETNRRVRATASLINQVTGASASDSLRLQLRPRQAGAYRRCASFGIKVMATLKLIIDLQGHKKFTYDLQITIANPNLRDKSLVFTSTSRLYRGKSKVYKGSLTFEGHTFPFDVVCKILLGSRVAKLTREANLYNTVLTPLHGVYVPLFLYHAQGVSSYTSLSMAASIMTYTGKPIGNTWGGTSDETRCAETSSVAPSFLS